MQGTAFQPNVFDRLANAWRGFKALPSPGQLFPPTQGNMGGGPFWVTFQGWDRLEQEQGNRDENRAKVAVQSPWVFADISAIANEFSAAELMVKEGDEDVDDHPLELLWRAPNPHMGRSYLMKYWAWSYTLVGKAYLYWLPAGGEVKELWPIPPFMIRPIPSSDDFISGYAFKARADAQPIVIPAEYVTYSHSVNLFDIRDGLSFLVAAMTGIESDLAMERWNRNFFDEQNGIPDGLITVQKDTLDTDLMRIRSELRDFFGGTRRGVAVARSGDLDYKPFGRSQKEVEFKEGIELASKIIGRTLGFPDGYWSETANRANAEQARATMIAGAVWPLLVQLAEDMNAGPIPRFYGEQYRAEFKDIRPEDRALKLQELQFYAQIETVNELRKRIGADELDDPRGLMLIAEINKGAPLPATPAQGLTDEIITEQEIAAGVGQGEEEAAPEEAPPPEEPPPQILGYHIEQGVVSRNEARARLDLPPEDESQSQWLRALQSNLSVVKVATEVGIPLEDALRLVGLNVSIQQEAPTAPEEPPTDEGAEPPIEEEAPPVDEGALEGGEVEALPEEEAAPMKADDLERWERKALKALKRFHAADVRFTSDAIPLPEQAAIHEALKAAETAEDVRAAFKATPPAQDDTDALIDAEWGAALKWARKVGG